MIPLADFRLYQAHRLMDDRDYRLASAIASGGRTIHLLRPVDFNTQTKEEAVLSAQTESERMQTMFQDRFEFETGDSNADN